MSMSVMRWTAGVLLLAVCLQICVSNIVLLRRSIVRKEHHSPIPLIGALFGIAGLLALPVPVSH
jgi:hypothetical protein